MKKMCRFLAGFLILIGLVGCASTKASQYKSKLNANVKSSLQADIEVSEKISGSASIKKFLGIIVISAPEKYAAGVNYNSEAGHEFSYFSTRVFPGDSPFCVPTCTFSDACFSSCIFPSAFNSELVTAAAAQDALNKSGADILVAPKYEIEYINHILVSEVKATVTGYKGKIKGIKTIEKDTNIDVEINDN